MTTTRIGPRLETAAPTGRGAAGAPGGAWRRGDRSAAGPATTRCRGGVFVLTDEHGLASEADTGTFEQLYLAISPRLRRFLRMAEPTEADDIASEVWLAVTGYLHRFRGDVDGFEALVFTIARRRVTDHRRRRATRRTDTVANESLAERAGNDEPEREAIDELRTRATLEELVRTLPRAQAEVVALRVMFGLPVEQVATMVGRSAGNVRILQHRALKRLRS